VCPVMRGCLTKQAARPRSGRKSRGPLLDKVEAWMTDYEVAGRRATSDAMAGRFGVSDRTGRRLLANVRTASTW
jgi:hypothetical protein